MPRPRRDNLELWQRYRSTRSDDDRNALIVAYLPLVERIAAKMFRKLPAQPLFDLDAMVNAGVPGLIDAIEGFDINRGLYFSTYSALRIQGSMLDEVRRHDWVPRTERSRAKQGLVTPAAVRQLRIEFSREGDEPAYGDAVVEQRPGPEARQATEDFWREWTRGLQQTERLIVLLYFREGLSMRQVGQHVGVGESRVSQVTSDICRRLRSRQAGVFVRDPLPKKRQPKRVVHPRSDATAVVPAPAPAPALLEPAPARPAWVERWETLSFRSLRSEKAAIRRAAAASGMTLSAWCREALMAAVKRSA